MKVISQQLKSVIGTEPDICEWENLPPDRQQQILIAMSAAERGAPIPPSCIVYPHTAAQLAEIIACAARNQWHVLICGRGSKLSWGGLAKQADIIVSTEHLNNLIAHAVGDLTVTVEAGMKFSHLQAILAQAGQFLALDPTYADATIGGIVATSDTNSLRQRYGSVRDQLLGITFVRADGQIAKAGGRVVKNVAGYDLMKLFAGSYGTLGVILEMTLRVYPLQSASATVVLSGTEDDVSQAARTLRGSALTPTQADLLSPLLVSKLNLGKGCGLISRFQGIGESVREQTSRLLEVGQKLGLTGEIYAGEDEVDLWQRLHSCMHADITKAEITCKIGVLPSKAVEVLTGIEIGCIHISSGLGWLRFASADVAEVLKLRSSLVSGGGFLSIVDAPATVKQTVDVWGYSGNALEVMRSIKKQFDPQNILNAGRFVGGI